MVTRQVNQAGREIQDVLEERSVQGLGFVAGSQIVGVISAQEIADRILPLLNMSREPQTAIEFTASGIIKGGVAAGLGLVSTRLTGLPLVVSAFAGTGALASAGGDLVNAVQRTGFFAESPYGGGYQGRSGGQSSASTSPSTSGSSSSGPSASTSRAGGAQADVTV